MKTFDEAVNIICQSMTKPEGFHNRYCRCQDMNMNPLILDRIDWILERTRMVILTTDLDFDKGVWQAITLGVELGIAIGTEMEKASFEQQLPHGRGDCP